MGVGHIAATPKRWRGSAGMVPSAIALIATREERNEVTSVGPITNVGLNTRG
jgi:hypothetical protein